jgi:hypothetical protein
VTRVMCDMACGLHTRIYNVNAKESTNKSNTYTNIHTRTYIYIQRVRCQLKLG